MPYLRGFPGVCGSSTLRQLFFVYLTKTRARRSTMNQHGLEVFSIHNPVVSSLVSLFVVECRLTPHPSPSSTANFMLPNFPTISDDLIRFFLHPSLW